MCFLFAIFSNAPAHLTSPLLTYLACSLPTCTSMYLPTFHLLEVKTSSSVLIEVKIYGSTHSLSRYFQFYLFICYFSSNKSLADSLDECVDPQDPNFNKVPNVKHVIRKVQLSFFEIIYCRAVSLFMLAYNYYVLQLV